MKFTYGKSYTWWGVAFFSVCYTNLVNILLFLFFGYQVILSFWYYFTGFYSMGIVAEGIQDF